MKSQQIAALKAEFMKLRSNPSLHVYFVNNDATKWHVSMMGPENSRWQDGIYHVSLDLQDYPNKAPHI